MAISNRCCYPEQRDCLVPLAGRLYLLRIRFFAKEAQNDRNVGLNPRDECPRAGCTSCPMANLIVGWRRKNCTYLSLDIANPPEITETEH